MFYLTDPFQNGDYLYDPFSSDIINIAKARVLTSLIDHERLDYFNSTSYWYIEKKQWCTLFSDLWHEISEMFHYNQHFSLTGLYLMKSLVNNYENGYKLKLRGENECKEALMHTYLYQYNFCNNIVFPYIVLQENRLILPRSFEDDAFKKPQNIIKRGSRMCVMVMNRLPDLIKIQKYLRFREEL
ncbi:hypothetical protein T11_1511 [Trichinella zimbabwensis]|uniref:Uncharacterized protein n=1 Tax=Trichinella zimbabwensis TaxID=268475 RepID=A0A0V1HUX4_9BILA|nr:hypothetical protein T11_1511 [Trichinella zimbabwensis]